MSSGETMGVQELGGTRAKFGNLDGRTAVNGARWEPKELGI